MRIPLGTFVLTLVLLVNPTLDDRAGLLRAKEEKTNDAPVLLQPYKVKGKPVTSFGISLYYVADARTQRILRLFVSEVLADTEAAAKGLKTGTEIIAADDIDIRTLDARFDSKSEFNRLFMNRKAGDRITLTILRKEGAKPRTVELTETPKRGD